MKSRVAVDGAQALLRVRPLGADAAAADDAAGLHVEDVGEVGADGDLQVEAHRPLAVVGQVEVLVQPAIDRAADDEGEGMCRDRAVLGEEAAVGQEDARGVVADRAAVQQVPRRRRWRRRSRR